MVKKTNTKFGIALIPALAMMLLLTVSVTAYFFMAQQTVATVTRYAGDVAAKWAARGGAYIAEEIMRNSLGVNCFTQTAGGVSITPVGMDLPGYVTAASGFYNVNPNVSWVASTITNFHVMLQDGPVNNRETTLTSDVSINYKSAIASRFIISVIYVESFMTDFAYYLDMGNDFIDEVPQAMNTGLSDGIRVNGFWNIAPWQTATITADKLEISGYIRVLSKNYSGTDGAGVSYGDWTWGPRDGWSQDYYGAFRLIDPETGSIITVPKDIFRFSNPSNFTYMDFSFMTQEPVDYPRDLAFWNNWRDTNNITTWLRDRTAGVQDFTFESLPDAEGALATFRTRSNQHFTYPAAAEGATPMEILQNRADALAAAINTEYGANVATGRVIVNLFRGDNVEGAVEINMQALVTAGLDSNNNAIHIAPENAADAADLSVILTNADNLSAGADVTLFVEGAVFTHGNVNTGAVTPLVTIISRDDQYVLSQNVELRRMYLGTAADESGHLQYDEQYVADQLCIGNPNYANHIHNDVNATVEFPLTGWYIDNWEIFTNGTPAQRQALIDQGYDAAFFNINPIDGQFWRYDGGVGSTTGVTPLNNSRNARYGKRIPNAADTTLNTAIISPAGRPSTTFENWDGADLNYNGSIILINDLGLGSAARNWDWQNKNNQLPSRWYERTSGGSNGGRNEFPTAGFDNVNYWTGTGREGSAATTQNYNNSLLNRTSPLTLDKVTRQVWLERIQR